MEEYEQLKEIVEAAAEDVAMDTAGGRATKADYIQAVAHLTEAVRGLQEISIEPVALAAE